VFFLHNSSDWTRVIYGEFYPFSSISDLFLCVTNQLLHGETDDEWDSTPYCGGCMWMLITMFHSKTCCYLFVFTVFRLFETLKEICYCVTGLLVLQMPLQVSRALVRA